MEAEAEIAAVLGLWSAKVDKIDTTGRWAMSVGDGRSIGDVSGRLAMSVPVVDGRCQWSPGA